MLTFGMPLSVLNHTPWMEYELLTEVHGISNYMCQVDQQIPGTQIKKFSWLKPKRSGKTDVAFEVK